MSGGGSTTGFDVRRPGSAPPSEATSSGMVERLYQEVMTLRQEVASLRAEADLADRLGDALETEMEEGFWTHGPVASNSREAVAAWLERRGVPPRIRY